MIKCPECGWLNSLGKDVCVRCGAILAIKIIEQPDKPISPRTNIFNQVNVLISENALKELAIVAENHGKPSNFRMVLGSLLGEVRENELTIYQTCINGIGTRDSVSVYIDGYERVIAFEKKSRYKIISWFCTLLKTQDFFNKINHDNQCFYQTPDNRNAFALIIYPEELFSEELDDFIKLFRLKKTWVDTYTKEMWEEVPFNMVTGGKNEIFKKVKQKLFPDIESVKNKFFSYTKPEKEESIFSIENMSKPSDYPKHLGNEVEINPYLSLKLENEETIIYVGGEKFKQCKYLKLSIPVDEMTSIEDLKSIDEISDMLDKPYEDTFQKEYKEIDPQVEFWGHCSNIQVWYEHNYNTNLLHSNLAFPLLKALTDAGDPLAKVVFSEEIGKRFDSGYLPVITYLILEGYLFYLRPEEWESIDFFRNVQKNITNPAQMTQANLIEGLKIYINKIKPKTPMEWVSKARFQRVFKDINKMHSLFEQGMKMFPNSETLVNSYIMELHKDNDLARGIPHFKRMTELKPDSSDVWNIYGSLFLKSGKYKEALKHFKKAVQLDPDYVLPKLNVARCLNKLGFIKARDDLLEKIVEMKIKDVRMLETIAGECDEFNRPDLVKKILKRYIFYDPESSIAWFALAEIYFEEKKMLQWKRCTKKIIMLNNEPIAVSRALNSLGVNALENHNPTKAAQYLERAVQTFPENDNAWLNLGLVLLAKLDMERSGLVMEISKLIQQKRMYEHNPKSPEFISINKEINSKINSFHYIGYKCLSCKRKTSLSLEMCPHCGAKLGLGKEDMRKPIDPNEIERLKREDSLFSKMSRITEREVLGTLSRVKWASLSDIYTALNVSNVEQANDVEDILKFLALRRVIDQSFQFGSIVFRLK